METASLVFAWVFTCYSVKQQLSKNFIDLFKPKIIGVHTIQIGETCIDLHGRKLFMPDLIKPRLTNLFFTRFLTFPLHGFIVSINIVAFGWICIIREPVSHAKHVKNRFV